MGTNIIVNREKCNQTIMYIQRQYDQIMYMAKKMDVDIIGIVENMSYVKCPDCDKKIYMFGKSHSQEVADRYQLPLLGQLPIDSELTQLSDQGYVENYHSDWFDEFSQKVKDI